MDLPFTTEQFLNVFVTYNETIAPLQIVAYFLGFLAVYFVLFPSLVGDRIISGILSSYWLVTGAGYHLQWFTTINSAAYLFGILFIIQGLWFLHAGILRHKLQFANSRRTNILLGLVLIGYAMLLYPLLNLMLGHSYPAMPVFGVAPCPTTIFTFGILLLARASLPLYLIIIPLLWSLIGVSAALRLGMWEDIGLVVAGIVGTIMIIHTKRHKTS